jgi:hypothetical protein
MPYEFVAMGLKLRHERTFGISVFACLGAALDCAITFSSFRRLLVAGAASRLYRPAIRTAGAAEAMSWCLIASRTCAGVALANGVACWPPFTLGVRCCDSELTGCPWIRRLGTGMRVLDVAAELADATGCCIAGIGVSGDRPCWLADCACIS